MQGYYLGVTFCCANLYLTYDEILSLCSFCIYFIAGDSVTASFAIILFFWLEKRLYFLIEI